MDKYHLEPEDIQNGNMLYGNLYAKNSNIKFKGKNNILYINGEVNIENSNIEFRGENSLIYICSSNDTLVLDIKVYNNSNFYMGKNTWINRGIKIVVSEETNVFFGNDNLISYDTCIRTADPHIIYDSNTHKRINNSRSVYVGDHVWIGQHVYILKGTKIGSGSIFGAMTLLSGKEYKSNCSYGGNPGKLIREGVFFLKEDCHRFTEEEKQKYDKYPGNEYIYEKDNNTLIFDEIEEKLNTTSMEERLKLLHNITANKNKNRFYI